ncbi:DUF2627 domain-containing protein [Bacillus testis]|uniref:DUF2627 domain-containing protein n=1 Tax=Bacillus testis TaxID=1622072 RepID=UPI00067F58FF|nr:DUF2627 domain-containing protein [Bacillus testis]
MARFLAFLILFIPGAFAALGIKLMRDMVFGLLKSPFPSLTLQFLCGFILMVGGIGFIAGFILHRDRKRNKVQQRFSTRKNV